MKTEKQIKEEEAQLKSNIEYIDEVNKKAFDERNVEKFVISSRILARLKTGNY